MARIGPWQVAMPVPAPIAPAPIAMPAPTSVAVAASARPRPTVVAVAVPAPQPSPCRAPPAEPPPPALRVPSPAPLAPRQPRQLALASPATANPAPAPPGCPWVLRSQVLPVRPPVGQLASAMRIFLPWPPAAALAPLPMARLRQGEAAPLVSIARVSRARAITAPASTTDPHPAATWPWLPRGRPQREPQILALVRDSAGGFGTAVVFERLRWFAWLVGPAPGPRRGARQCWQSPGAGPQWQWPVLGNDRGAPGAPQLVAAASAGWPAVAPAPTAGSRTPQLPRPELEWSLCGSPGAAR